MYVIRVHSAEEIDDAMVLLSVLAHVKLEVTSPHTIVLKLEGDNRLRKKTIEEKLGCLRSFMRWHADDADIEKCINTEEVRAKYNVSGTIEAEENHFSQTPTPVPTTCLQTPLEVLPERKNF
ncbi:unnamed protein product [Darwinula stevensoni]|uniref:Uncharacterized protein n=1 Tax=Darwinula stevensoni TaxID=69355 RepID=A0A7R9AF43_9CRUS|nr:unnamed protein product [Darwinula stevensoni]CAG0902250.1 unnamed protein product [Darwinula stevensoni]